MQKSKRPTARKTAITPEDHDEALTQELVELAIELASSDEKALKTDALKQKKHDFQRIIKKGLQQNKDEMLYDAIERALDEDSEAFQLLKASVEEASEVIVLRREDGRNGHDVEVNAFVIPLFAHTSGGLDLMQCFQDEEAYDLLSKSFKEAELESPDSTVVLVSHAYHLDEISGITYSHLNEMVREAYDSMTRKKATAAPAIGRSMSGWPENHFEPDDQSVELRFLLGFALKSVDDAFYRVPEKESAADRYFEKRAERFQQWAKQNAPLVKRCLATDGRTVEIDFLYQDLFHGGTERGVAEYYMLQMLSELHQDLHEHNTQPQNTTAIIGPADVDGEVVLRVNLYAATDGALVASSDKPIGVVRDLQIEADDAYDALMSIGVKALSLAMKFDMDGQPVDVRPYEL